MSGPPKVDRLVMAVEPPMVESNEPRNLNQSNMWQLKPAYEYLVGIDETSGKLVPQLATEWTVEDGTNVRFKLRKGVQFHQGRGEFTARDVDFSITNFSRPDSRHGQAAAWSQLVKGIDVVSDYEALLRLSQPDGSFFRAISEAESSIEIVSHRHAETSGDPTMQTEPLVGTGPYEFKERQQAQYVRFERAAAQHWRATSSDFPTIEFRFIKEASTRLAALLTNEVHMAALPPDLSTDADARGMKTIAGRLAGQRIYMPMKCCFMVDPKDLSKGMRYPSSPLADIRVRKALQKAINIDELNRTLLHGKGQLMLLNGFHPTREGWNPDWERRYQSEYGYDPDAARRLLAESGRQGMETNLFIGLRSGVPSSDDVTEAIAKYWRAVGVNVNLLNVDGALVNNGARQQRWDNHSSVEATSASVLTGAAAFNGAIGKSATFPSVQDPAVDVALLELYREVDPVKQEALFRKLGDLMFDRAMNINLLWLPAEITVNPRVVSDYTFPGISGSWTHVQNIKAAR